MKKALILVFSIFLLSSLNCATTKKLDLTGTWLSTEEIVGCGTGRTENYTGELAQKGDTVTYVDSKRDMTLIGKIYNDIIMIDRYQRTTYGNSGVNGTVEVHAYKVKISEDGETLTSEISWSWKGTQGNKCNGITYLTSKRKPKE
jgi:hypothetical protein